jgi:hypothetical protein
MIKSFLLERRAHGLGQLARVFAPAKIVTAGQVPWSALLEFPLRLITNSPYVYSACLTATTFMRSFINSDCSQLVLFLPYKRFFLH